MVPDVQVSNISFPDFDLDETDLGGTLTWTPPVDESQIEHYVPWLLSSSSRMLKKNGDSWKIPDVQRVYVFFSNAMLVYRSVHGVFFLQTDWVCEKP